jgi:germination protein M
MRRPLAVVRGRRPARVGAALAVVGVLAIGVGVTAAAPARHAGAPQPARTVASSSSSTTTTAPKAAKPAKPAMITVSLYFVRGNSLGVAERQVRATPDPRNATLQALLAGPTPAERAAGLSTDIPSGTELRGLSIGFGGAIANFNPTLLSGGSSAPQSPRAAQIVYTLTQFPNVGSVLFQIAGNRISGFGGVNYSAPVKRPDLLSMVPTVVMETPALGSVVHSPLNLAGLSGFVGTYYLQLVDSTGKQVVNTLGTSAIGSSFTATIPYTTTATGPGTLKLFTRAGARGSSLQEVDVPVTVGP